MRKTIEIFVGTDSFHVCVIDHVMTSQRKVMPLFQYIVNIMDVLNYEA